MGSQHIVELNGQRYDALTGALITTPPVAAKKTQPRHTPTGNMDGFAKPNRAIKQQAAHQRLEKSKTLMRKTVTKPKVTPAATKATASKPRIISSASATRTRHGGGVPRSPLISHFGGSSQARHTKSVKSTMPATVLAAAPAVTVSPHTAAKQRLDPIAKGLAASTSHEQPKVKKAKLHARVAHKLRISPRTLSTASFVAAFLLIGGFFAYQNVPGLTMRLAATRSGVQGSLPSYRPSGFKLAGGIAYKSGQITINYKSNSDDRNFKVIQDTSNWDSQSLLENYVAVNRQDYQTVQDKGKTIYIYDDSNATWVDGGIWYRIEGDSKLNSDQLLRLAASL